MLNRLRYASNPETKAKYQAKARARIPVKCEYEKQKRRKEAAEQGRMLYKRKPIHKFVEDAIVEEYQREVRILQKEEKGLYWWKEKTVFLAVQRARAKAAYYSLEPEERRQKAKARNTQRTPEQKAEYKRRYWERLNADPKRKKEMTRKRSKAARLAKKPHQKAKENLRNRFRKRLKQFNKTKWDSFSNLLGCKWSFFVKWIEKQWARGMRWDNYGTAWHIDHIEPLAVFDVNDRQEMRRAWHYTNLRPLKAKENMDKSDSIITHQPELTLCL